MKFRLLAFAALLAGAVAAQTPARATLSFQIGGMKPKRALLGYYYGGQTYRVDSAQITPAGQFVFRPENLQAGLYFVAGDGKRLFDFVVASATDSIGVRGTWARLDSLVAEGSTDNEAYFSFEKERKKLEAQITAKEQMLQLVGRATDQDASVLEPVKKDLEALYQSGDSFAVSFIKNYPTALYAQMLRAVRPPEPPKSLPPTLKGQPNPKHIAWQRAHYFDHTDFGDERLLRNNFWHAHFDNFFARFVAPQPDSLMQAIDEVLQKMPRNGAFYRFAVVRLTQYFEQRDAPGADRVFVHLVDKYQRKGETPWLDAATLERLAYKADTHRPNLTGSLAVNIELADENGQPHALYQLEAPITMLVFYSPLCEHCKELMPKIYQTYLDFAPKGLKAMALNADNQYVYWKNFVAQQGWEWIDLAAPKGIEDLEKQYAAYNLPVIYLLDKDKRILAKRVNPVNLGATLAKLRMGN
jgi:thiol-disulfide isomerase/thioredoxin